MSILSTRHGRTILMAAIVALAACAAAHASGPPANEQDGLARVLISLVIIMIAAKVGGELFVRIGQPPVLGELILGIVVGNLYLLGFHGFDSIVHVGKSGAKIVDPNVEILSGIGVVLLLFQVGLESDMKKMMSVGGSALMVATLGIVAPFFLGWGVATIFLPREGTCAHMFVGAALCATSVGITARVMLDLGWIQTAEARIILGAAVIDDVQGLVILAVVSGIITAASDGTGSLSASAVLWIVLKATAFLAGALVIGRWAAPKVFRISSRMKAADLLLTTALGLCFAFAYMASEIGLAPIVGAFAAGLILEEIHWRDFRERGERSVNDLVKPLAGFLVPVFFVVMGARVNLTTFADVRSVELAGALTAAAIIGKQICGLGVLQKGLDRLSVGIGMIPRGEVGLIFAAIGSQLRIGGEPVVGAQTFSAVVIMVIITTVITPPALKWSVGRVKRIAPSDSGKP